MGKLENMRKLRICIWAVIIVAVVGSWLNLPSWIVDSIIAKIVLGPLIGIFTGAIAGEYADLLDKLTKGALKEEWTIEIGDASFSIPIVVIVAFIIEVFLFY